MERVGPVTRIKPSEAVRGIRRIPFTAWEIGFAEEFVQQSSAKGRDLRLGSRQDDVLGIDFGEAAADGMITLESPIQLGFTWMFFKADAGRTLFGRQKSAYPSFLSDGFGNDWTIGPLFKSFTIAITSIGNVYRGL